MLRPIPIGVDDFRKLREQDLEYVDKSDLICGVLDKGADVLLLPRPRRFGKRRSYCISCTHIFRRLAPHELAFREHHRNVTVQRPAMVSYVKRGAGGRG